MYSGFRVYQLFSMKNTKVEFLERMIILYNAQKCVLFISLCFNELPSTPKMMVKMEFPY